MTLTELKYIVAVARERHFGRAAEACFVSQPTLSVAIRKLEEELAIQIFERGPGEISVTPVGIQVVEQAQRVLEQAQGVREIAAQGRDPLAGPLRVGVIHTIGPYLLPALIRRTIADIPQMPLLLQENFTVKLLELLRQGEIDVAILAEPLPSHGLVTQPVYDEPFVVAVPVRHPWAQRQLIPGAELRAETMLLLGTGHCFRDQVLEVCPELSRYSQASTGIRKTFEGSSLETIRHMVAAGIGITVLPATASPAAQPSPQSIEQAATPAADGLLAYIPFESPVPSRRVLLAWRRSFARPAAIEAVRRALLDCELPGAVKLPAATPILQ